MKKLLILFLIFALLAATGCKGQTIAPSATSTPSPEPTLAPESPTVAASAEATAIPNAGPAISDFANKEVTLDNVETALKGFFAEGEYIGTDVENSGGIIYVTITYRPSTVLSEKDFAVQVGHHTTMVMEVLFLNESVNVVTFKGDTPTVEGAMEIGMTKEIADTVDWVTLKNQTQTDYKAILDLADNYYMHNSISDKLE